METEIQEKVGKTGQRLFKEKDMEKSPETFKNPKENYRNRETHENEVVKIIRKSPIFLCFSSDLKDKYSYVTDNILGIPILATRNEENKLNAFINICSHRGATLEKDKGCKSRFSCPFHGWTYDTNGELIHPHPKESFDDDHFSKFNLKKVEISESCGMVWVHLDGEKSTINKELQQELNSYLPENHILHSTERKVINANWKLAIESFLESYHISFLHRESILRLFSPNISTLGTFGESLRYVVFRKSIEERFDKPDENWNIPKNALIVYLAFPSTIILWQVDHFEVWRCLPLDEENPDKSIVELFFYIPKDGDTEDRKNHWKKNYDTTTRTVYQEDMAMAQEIQAGIGANATPGFTYGRHETALIHFHKSLREVLSPAEEQ